MNYPTRCTHCITLLKNSKAFQKAHFYMNMNEVYIDVEDYTLSTMILLLNDYQEGTYETYKQILKYIDKEA